jgi:hypothetical protein
VCGLGGVLVEVLRDVVHHLTPVTDVDARDIGKLRARRSSMATAASPPETATRSPA